MKRNPEALSERRFDLVIIGGGINGSAIAREASLRGLKTALIDARDFASGTSSRSSKLIHGGLRYLAQGEIKLVREARRERKLLMKLAPHLARPLRFCCLFIGQIRIHPSKYGWVSRSMTGWATSAGMTAIASTTLRKHCAVFPACARRACVRALSIMIRSPMMRA